MPVFELGKSIESIRLNKRNRLPMGEPPRTIPFGALVEEISERGDRASFVYLGELYECVADVLRSALLASGSPATGENGQQATGSGQKSKSPPAEPKQPPSLAWERVESSEGSFSRARVPGGWLVMAEAGGLAFIPDADRSW
jgi:hypothetical protein